MSLVDLVFAAVRFGGGKEGKPGDIHRNLSGSHGIFQLQNVEQTVELRSRRGFSAGAVVTPKLQRTLLCCTIGTKPEDLYG